MVTLIAVLVTIVISVEMMLAVTQGWPGAGRRRMSWLMGGAVLCAVAFGLLIDIVTGSYAVHQAAEGHAVHGSSAAAWALIGASASALGWAVAVCPIPRCVISLSRWRPSRFRRRTSTDPPSSAYAPARERWRSLVLASLVCLQIGLSAQAASRAIAYHGDGGAPAESLAVLLLVVFTWAAVRVASWIAYSAGRVPPELVAGGRSRGVPLAIAGAACFYVWVEPWLYRVGYMLGFRGTTTLATTLPHRLDAPVVVLVWGTILVAPWIEELTFRGFLLSGLSARFGFWPAAAVSSVLWATWHGVSGVLVPFTAAGLLLCWIRRRTGSTRTGIALHSANNVLAALAVGVSATLVVPPVTVVVLSLAVTRPGPPGRLARVAARLLEIGRRVADALTARLTARRAPSVWAWSGVVCAIATAVCLVITAEYLGVNGRVAYLVSRAVVVVGVIALGYATLGARSAWSAPPGTSLAGAIGAAALALAVACPAISTDVRAALAYTGLTLISFGLIGLILGSMPVRARTSAGAAGVLLLGALNAPLPYLNGTSDATGIQALAFLTGAAACLIAISVTTRPSQATRHTAAQGYRHADPDAHPPAVTVLRQTLTVSEPHGPKFAASTGHLSPVEGTLERLYLADPPSTLPVRSTPILTGAVGKALRAVRGRRG